MSLGELGVVGIGPLDCDFRSLALVWMMGITATLSEKSGLSEQLQERTLAKNSNSQHNRARCNLDKQDSIPLSALVGLAGGFFLASVFAGLFQAKAFTPFTGEWPLPAPPQAI